MKIHFISFLVVDEDGSQQLSGVHDVSGSYQSEIPSIPQATEAIETLNEFERTCLMAQKAGQPSKTRENLVGEGCG
jgi:hypothetical protein